MSETLTLRGCSPEPLSNYLKALGVLRLLAEPNYCNKDKSLKRSILKQKAIGTTMPLFW
jgi:hypothetical protein